MKLLERIRSKRAHKSNDLIWVLVDTHTGEQVIAFKNNFSAGVAQNIGWRDNIQQTYIVEMQRKDVLCEMAPQTFYGG